VLIWRSVASVQLAGKSRITKINELGLERIMAAFVVGRLRGCSGIAFAKN